MSDYEVIVLGLGAMGSAAAYQLARRGTKILGIDQFSPPHALGSSHGETRITRLAIGEGTAYTPLALRSHEIWRDIEAEACTTLLTTTGGLVISSAQRTSHLHVDDFFANTLAAARAYNIDHEILDSGAIRRRFPPFAVRNGELGYYEPEAGVLSPETCIAAQLALAEQDGAEFHRNEKVLGFEETGTKVRVTTDQRSYEAERLIVTAGAWLPGLLGGYGDVFKIYRQCLFWFAVNGPVEPFLPGAFPVFIWEVQGRDEAIYGFPAMAGAAGGVKIATQRYEVTTTPETMNREVSEEEKARMYQECATPYLPGIGPDCLNAAACLYTVTPDSHFVIDVHPEMPRVLVASPCSGHGFKHSAAIGEALAEWTIRGRARLDLSPFRLNRFAQSPP